MSSVNYCSNYNQRVNDFFLLYIYTYILLHIYNVTYIFVIHVFFFHVFDNLTKGLGVSNTWKTDYVDVHSFWRITEAISIYCFKIFVF